MITLQKILGDHARLEASYDRLARLDANGACCVASDILEAAADGCLNADTLADELEATCDEIEGRE